MSFDDLARQRVIEPIEVSNEEIAYLLQVARRDIDTANSLKKIGDLDWAFAIAYNAILQLSIAYMNFLGFRPRGEGKHLNTFRFMERVVTEKERPMVKRLQQLRRKRNITIYERPGQVSEKEANQVVEFASRYYKDTEDKLPKTIVKLSHKEE